MAAIESLETADPDALAGYDMVIDVRSPAEFAEDHAPGAVNLPVLSDAERAEVGTIYVQTSKFEARRIGASYVARNVADHLAGPLADKGGGFRPLLYCWRGGMRSNAMAIILAEVGWRAAVLKGGYKTYRARVREKLYDEPMALKVVLIDGPTGSAKTEILRRAGLFGAQTIDLEGLAEHRGSLLGALPGRPQPGQKLFESRLLAELERLDPARPVLVEAESSKVGDLVVPPALWSLMTGAPRIRIETPAPARVAYLMRAYADTVADREALDQALSRLPLRLGRKRIDGWRVLARGGVFEELAEELLSRHYDPAYARSSRSDERTPIEHIPLSRLDDAALDAAAHAIAERLG
ncbi:MAG TPA: tRNA 2-selenouridine(34) synthase MnmH [Caulobacteraceae bacterium]|jgi:tRNA 2-selenouridine synthase|nr:tRNA 2-selenouridine(34) synthase MnmH [Caulobacteraceae bacterium]